MIKLDINNLKLSYKDNEVLKCINLTVSDDEIISIIGSSGSGKSTLLNCLSLINDEFDCDNFFINEVDLLNKSSKEMRKFRLNNIGIIFQNYNLIEEYTIMDNIIVILKFAGIEVNEETIVNVLKELGIDNLKEKKVYNLSGGEKQRVAIARTILLDPKIILADEPTGALDYDNTLNVFKVLEEQCKKKKLPLIIVTHDLTVANMCDKILELKNGVLLEKELKKTK